MVIVDNEKVFGVDDPDAASDVDLLPVYSEPSPQRFVPKEETVKEASSDRRRLSRRARFFVHLGLLSITLLCLKAYITKRVGEDFGLLQSFTLEKPPSYNDAFSPRNNMLNPKKVEELFVFVFLMSWRTFLC